MTSDFVVAYACLRIFANILGCFFLRFRYLEVGSVLAHDVRKPKCFRLKGKGLDTSQIA